MITNKIFIITSLYYQRVDLPSTAQVDCTWTDTGDQKYHRQSGGKISAAQYL